ncbi:MULTISPECIES: cytochrome c oxidase accessory protein CcoG [Sphingobium]|uniref:Cytochrome c oxidase accessory protein CcoG n=1 Tax=Sphingobium fuliginis (strain ATCC 27551) TaxID=336203 RepID=A0ABQ1F341_SPHSA|nr:MULTISPECIES: cytochrome c oxidase accessory protein CcoG [Sphingobium]RYL96832.1 cytochrome c oxidase accessory protein CcoG [Sphingobium fuliginis]WDA35937.1 cytochrome c oxidase accessory protein CcoG [Sphingobium sp. YC-XJ3]GFZ98016.1 cytochrome c oxidase accessory protein CcoG [Sphingobium fuliginis]
MFMSGSASLYEKRKGVYPKAVDGFYRRLKWAIMAVTLTIYWGTPWLRWDRGPYAPDQAVLVDLAHRRFYMFSIEIWPQEFYYVAGLLIMAGIGLFLVTSAVGRAWCGYACPQTVWTDLYQHVERFVDGDRNAQLRLAKAPWGAAKIARRLFKWSVWLGIAFVTGGAWIFYFADAPTLQREFWSGTAAWQAYATTFVLTATTFVLGGFMREQVCIYMCPWPRIQTAMLDEKSLIVTYKHWRGETRGSLKKAQAHPGAFGDCVDCNQCVAVCPTGIDIREGPQIGCITCALCIDACDKVMAQVGRPRGLIDYCTQDDAEAEQKGAAPRPVLKTLLRPRTIAYFAVWAGIGAAMLFALGARERLEISAQQDRNPIFVRLSDGAIRNAYTVKLRNMQARPRPMEVGLTGLPGGRMWTDAGLRETAATTVRTTVPADSVAKLRIFLTLPSRGPARQDFRFTVRAIDREGGSASEPARFERP